MNTGSNQPTSKIGIGSYGVGGRGHRTMVITEQVEDDNYINTIAHGLLKGLNFTEISLGYGHGRSLELFKQGLDKSKLKREDIFITHSLYPIDLPTLDIIHEDIASFYKVMNTDYADSTLVTQSLFAKFDKGAIYLLLNELLSSKKTRYVSLSNASPQAIRDFKKEFGDKFIAHEGHLSFEVRALQDKGVFDICKELEVENIIWRPLRRNKTMTLNWPLLVELSKKYQKSQNQIVLNWICSLGYKPMVMSASREHMDENIAATEFEMSAEDYIRITKFRPNNYHPPNIDWENDEDGDKVVALVNEFERHID